VHRLFVAIRPPHAIRERLLATMGGIPGARWQSDDQLHLTLRFIGEVNRHCAEDVAAALGSIHHPRFELALDGIGQFDRKGRIEILWAGVTPHGGLKSLHNKIDQALSRIGLPAEGRAYLPHITLARFSRGAGSVGSSLLAPPMVAGPAFDVRDFYLFESDLGTGGAVYSIVERYALA
jgi:2'-5' RNA ligase